MTTPMFNTELLPIVPSAVAVVVRVVAIAGNVPWGLEQHMISEPRRRKPDGVFRLSSSRKVGPEEEDWSTVGSGTTSTRRRSTDAEFIVHFLGQQGIKTTAGIPGGSILPVYGALGQNTQVRHTLTCHEQGVRFIAQGMARTGGKPAIYTVCSKPGATSLVTTIADARLGSIPLVCITGQVPASMVGTDTFQEVDTYGTSISTTKHNYLVRHIEELPQIISDAFRIARSGHPDPVWIDIPKGV